MLEFDTEQRHIFEQNNHTNNPLSSITAEERHIIFRPMPHYSLQRNEDEAFDAMKCPISQEVPEVQQMVRQRGSVYSKDGLHLLRSGNASSTSNENPMTRSPLRKKSSMAKKNP